MNLQLPVRSLLRFGLGLRVAAAPVSVRGLTRPGGTGMAVEP